MNTPHRDCLSGLFFVKLDVLRALFQTISTGKDEESNWLPAPNGPFSLYIPAYWADKAILDGTWKPPVVKQMP